MCDQARVAGMRREPLEELVLRPSLIVFDLDALEFIKHARRKALIHDVVGVMAEVLRSLDR